MVSAGKVMLQGEIDTNLRDRVKIQALKRGTTMAKVLEIIVKEWLDMVETEEARIIVEKYMQMEHGNG